MNVIAEGTCELCGSEADSSESYRCEDCSALLERMATERREKDSCLTLERYHFNLAMTLDEGWARRENISLANSYYAMSNAHHARYMVAREKLDKREYAWTEQLQIAGAA